jgi:hypothetical protein
MNARDLAAVALLTLGFVSTAGRAADAPCDGSCLRGFIDA